MTITTNRESDQVTLLISGRIDSNTSTELQDALLQTIDSTYNVVLDFAEVSYISSAGLRVLLIGHKSISAKAGSMTIKNISSMVLQVLETVGFDKVLSLG